ncbi:MAG: ribosome maturation factor RimP [Enterobacterales bacterium]|nr:ribosome maturation factor RimP [Enterobacterales bacterium]
MTVEQKLNELVAPTITAMQYEFVGLEYLSGAKPIVLRIYIDHEDGINVDDCALVSRQISAVLDVEDPIKGEYNLEVSSPGLNKPLFRAEHYQSCIGERISLKLRFPIEGRRKYTGQLLAADEQTIEMQVDNQSVELKIVDIEKANMIFNHKK